MAFRTDKRRKGCAVDERDVGNGDDTARVQSGAHGKKERSLCPVDVMGSVGIEVTDVYVAQ